MNDLTPARLLRVAEDAPSDANHVAILGRDIRTSSERIANYCVTRHEPIYEDLAALVEGMAYWDRRLCGGEPVGGHARCRSSCRYMSTGSFSERLPLRHFQRLPGS